MIHLSDPVRSPTWSPRPSVRAPSRRTLLPAVVLALACTAACSDTSQPAAYDAPRDAQRIITGLGIEITSNGRRALRVEADSGFVQEGSSKVTLVGVRARAFGDDGLVRMTLEADSGSLDEATRVFTASGDVRARSQDGSVSMEAVELVFDPSTGRLSSDSSVVVDRSGRTERGSCFEGDPTLSSFRVCGGPS